MNEDWGEVTYSRVAIEKIESLEGDVEMLLAFVKMRAGFGDPKTYPAPWHDPLAQQILDAFDIRPEKDSVMTAHDRYLRKVRDAQD